MWGAFDGVDGTGVKKTPDAGAPGSFDDVARSFHVDLPNERVFPGHDGNDSRQVIDGIYTGQRRLE